MNLIRPELLRWLGRWGESVGAGALAMIGLLLLWRGLERYNWMTQAIGVGLLALGAAAFWASYQRSRFSAHRHGPGLVEITERRISYLTPAGGGSVDIAAMTRLELRSTLEFGRVWVLKQSEGPTLFVPVSATGAENLFDAFSALPGIETAKLISALNSPGDQRNVVWRGSPRFRPLT